LLKAIFDRNSWFMVAVRECFATYAYALLFYAAIAGTVVDVGYVAITRGIIAAVVCFMFGGAYANPVLSFVALCSRKLRFVSFAAQVVAQFVAVILAAATADYGLGLDMSHAVPTCGAHSHIAGFMAEFIGTLIIGILVACVCEESFWRMRSVFVGVTYIPIAIALGPISGAYVDPFLALGASIFSHFSHDAWVYYAGPAVGAAGAIIIATLAHLTDIHDADWIIVPKPK
jgi:glycerol uptake facilitator-like aquaporin